MLPGMSGGIRAGSGEVFTRNGVNHELFESSLREHPTLILKEMDAMKPKAKILVTAMALSTLLAFPHTLLAASDTASNSAEPPRGTGMAMMPVEQQMQRMQEQMAKLHDTANPKERRELMRGHAQSMQGMMKMMHGMMAGQGMMEGQRSGMGMMMPGQMGSPGTGNPQSMGPGAMAPGVGAIMGRMGMMEQRMNMMQMMMDQMLQQQEQLLKDKSDGDS